MEIKAITGDLEKQMRLLGELSKGINYNDIKMHFDEVYDDPAHNQFDFVLGLLCGTIARGEGDKAILVDLTLNGRKHFV